MQLKAVIHEAEEGGSWAKVPFLPGWATQSETFEELLQNLGEAVEGCLAVEVSAECWTTTGAAPLTLSD